MAERILFTEAEKSIKYLERDLIKICKFTFFKSSKLLLKDRKITSESMKIRSMFLHRKFKVVVMSLRSGGVSLNAISTNSFLVKSGKLLHSSKA